MKKSFGLMIMTLALILAGGHSGAAPSVRKPHSEKKLAVKKNAAQKMSGKKTSVKKRLAKKSAPSPLDKRLSTDVSFDGSLVSGKYQFPDEAVATVEDEKSLDDLLGIRKHFKDRLRKSMSRN
jgi:hypothetical protein